MCTRQWHIVATAFCIYVVFGHAASLRSAPRRGQLGPTPPLSKSLQTAAGPIANSTSTLFTFSAASPATVTDSPELFVAVLTTRSTPTDKRNAIRELWKEVDGGQGHICARFIVCRGNDKLQPILLAEQKVHGDMLFLQCAEGYAHGLLTKKVIASMQAYRDAASGKDACLDRPLFMKMDDDTFVAGRRFRHGLSAAIDQFGSDSIYAGVDLPGQAAERNASSPWYEPPSVWPHDYAPAMYGGPGYILGRALVHRIVDDQIAGQNILWNEDRAVGVWIRILEQRLVRVAWMKIPGTNGFKWDHPVTTGTWQMYPYTLHHHLSNTCIRCLTKIDQANAPDAPLDVCFAK